MKERMIKVLDDLSTEHKRLYDFAIANPEKVIKHQVNLVMNDETKKQLLDSIEFLEKKDDKTINDYIGLRNLRKMIYSSQIGLVFCPMLENNITNKISCFGCGYGHLMECHYPFDCDSPYCNHYPDYERISKEDFWKMQEVLVNDNDREEIYKAVFKNFTDEAKEIIGKLENYVEAKNNKTPICAICSMEIATGVPIRFFTDDNMLELDFHRNCCFKPDFEDLPENLNEPIEEEF